MNKKIGLLLIFVSAFSMLAGCGNAQTETAADEVVEEQTVETGDNTSETVESTSETEEDTSIVSNEDANFTVEPEFALLGTDTRGTSGMVYVISKVTNNSETTYSLNFNKGNLSCKAFVNDEELEKPHLGSMDVPGDVAPGETITVGSGFTITEVGDVTIKWYDDAGDGAEIASVTYTTDELYQTSKDFVNDSFDTSEYKEEFVLLEDQVKQYLEDLGEL